MYRQCLVTLLFVLLGGARCHVAQDTEKCTCECQQHCEQVDEDHDIPNPIPHGQYVFHGQPGQPGIPGINGNHGIPGMTGAPGRVGDRGPRGEKGELSTSNDRPHLDCIAIRNCSMGEKGDIGEQGERGLPGIQGVASTQAKIAFSAGRTKTMTSHEPGSDITYDSLFVNAGRDFNKETGIFTCRINGTYYFTMHIANFYDIGDNNLYVQLLKNEKHIVSVYHHDDSGYRDSVSNSVILPLVRGDRVKLFLEGNRHLYSSSRRFTTFSGYMLFQD